MMPRGIPFAQIESNTELDSKLQRLARTLEPVAYYAAFGAYMSIVLKAWSTADRDADDDLLAMIPTETLASLRQVGLLDAEGRLSEEVFLRRIGSVLDERRRDAERKRGAKPSADVPVIPPESAGVQRKEADIQPVPVDSDVEQSRAEENSSLLANARNAAGAPTSLTSADWLRYVLDKDGEPRDVVKADGTTVHLSKPAERIARIGDYYTARLGKPLRDGDGGRLARLLNVHPRGERGLLEDIDSLGFDDPKGDPIDYLTKKVNRRTTNGTDRNGGKAAVLAGTTDYDAAAGLTSG